MKRDKKLGSNIGRSALIEIAEILKMRCYHRKLEESNLGISIWEISLKTDLQHLRR